MGHADIQLTSPEFNDARRALAIFCQPENLAVLREQMAAEGPYEPAWQSASRLLEITWDQAPAHVNVQVKGELGFLVDRRVWQSAVFATFVRCNVNPTFGRGAVVEWCRAALGARNVILRAGDGLAGQEAQSLDVVLCNPPFHQQQVVGDFLAWRMFQQAREALVVGGALYIVGNRHLGYHSKLARLFRGVEQVANTPKFVILKARK